MTDLEEKLEFILSEKTNKLRPENIRKDVKILNVRGTHIADPLVYPNWAELGCNEIPMAMINDFNYSKDIYDNWNSSTTNMQAKFFNDDNIIFFPLINTANVTTMSQCFYRCRHLRHIPLLNTINNTAFDYLFSECLELKDVPQFNTIKATTMYYAFSGCNKLTDESLNNILAMCININPSYSRAKTLSELGLSSTYYPVTRLQTLSNYQAFLNAGWTAGY